MRIIKGELILVIGFLTRQENSDRSGNSWRTKKKMGVLVIGVIILLVSIVGAYRIGYNSGYSTGEVEGFEKGYPVGLENGFDNGYEKGYENGYSIGLEEGYTTGFENGYEKGLENSYTVGFNEGYENGFSIGYDNGLEEGKSIGLSKGMKLGFENGYQKAMKEMSLLLPRIVEDGSNEFLFQDETHGTILEITAKRKEDLIFDKLNFEIKNVAETQISRLYVVLLKFPPTEGLIVEPYQKMIIKDVYPGETVSKRTFEDLAPDQRYELLVRVEFLKG